MGSTSNILYRSYAYTKMEATKLPIFRWFSDDYTVNLVTTDKYPVRGNEIGIQNMLAFIILLLIPAFTLFLGLLFLYLVWEKKRS